MTNSYPSWPDQITKLAAAERQLVTAIRLFFTNGDSVAVHTLAGAVAEVAESLCVHRSIRPFREHAKDVNASLSDKEFWALRNKHRNFFKHATDDPNASISFSDEDNDGLLYVAASDLSRLREKNTPPEAQVMDAWFCATNQEKLVPDRDVIQKLNKIFPNIHRLPRYRQKRMGFEALDWSHSEPALWGKFPWTGESRMKFQ